jgi:peptidoglycan/LPS O-acetylase OafA/YrhL
MVTALHDDQTSCLVRCCQRFVGWRPRQSLAPIPATRITPGPGRVAYFLGGISYPIYLLHAEIGKSLGLTFGLEIGPALILFITVTILAM